MRSYENQKYEYNIKVNSDVETLKKVLLNCHYQNVACYYQLIIYMIPDSIDILSIENLLTLDSYVMIQDLNGDNKHMIYKEKGSTSYASIDNISATKDLLNKLNYNELMYLNFDVYCFEQEEKKIVIKNIKEQGIYMSFDNKEAIEILEQNHISYDHTNMHIDNEKIALENMKKELKNKANR